MKSTVVTKDVKYDIHRALFLIEQDKDLLNIYKKKVTTLPFSLIHSMAKNGNIDSVILNKIEEIFSFIILKNPSMIEKYEQLSITPTKQRKSKYYGKKRILQDIGETNQKTELDRAMLALNNLRNILAKVRNRGISDKTKGTNILSIEDCRDIIAGVNSFEKKVTGITRKKLNKFGQIKNCPTFVTQF